MRPTSPQSLSHSEPFPYRQLTILAICRLSEPIAFMSIFPYIYYMIKSFHITDNEESIALYMGMVISAFALAEAMSSCLWGRLSDKLGRKLILLCGLAGTGVSMLVFGFATNIYVALLARALGGLLNGNIGVLQTTISEVVKNDAHKGFGFALMPAVWCVGAAIGSALGGALADPVRSYPGVFKPGSYLDEYPYLLPNLVCVVVVIVAILVGIFYLEETHEDLKDRRDYGLEMGKWVEFKLRPSKLAHLMGSKGRPTDETLSLLSEEDAPPGYQSTAGSPDLRATSIGLPPPYQSIEGASLTSTKPHSSAIEPSDPRPLRSKRSSSVWHTLTKQLMLNVVGLGILAYHTISAEQLLPVLFSMPESDAPPALPFRFTGGFALSTKSIGGILSLQGVLQMFATMVIFPTIQLRLGTLSTYRLAVLTYPFLYLLVPYLTLVPGNLRMPAVYVILVWKVTAQAFSFPANNMMLSNATPRTQRGTFNGVAQSSASLARAIGPSVSGLLQAAGLSKHMLGLPWWVNALVATLGAVMSLMMVEQASTSSHDEKEDAEDEEAAIEALIAPMVTDSADDDVAMIAARSPPEVISIARPTSPLLTRLSLDLRRNTSSSAFDVRG
ncbi:major facilitator superfamily domain-containing protein [Neohortaea acidophila]|uniref:Major facilitator superfamily domain-containing protein n=1 Tax=Neohortaea acidophila TaxID=245834 RepID=A0A6A6PJR9_9PEZI|nr:major facilitator superfamily domain-containing protein [Neohortaea acidophila]KAF2480249.1 major facilitator superfamily domain-containing protein [Neohortaea acidophila]